MTKRSDYAAVECEHGEQRVTALRAASVEEAATHAIHRLYGRSTIAVRVTGVAGLSGRFEGYRALADGTLNSYGHNVHVW